MTTTPIDLAGLRALAKAATPGPWSTEKFGDAHEHGKWGDLYKLIGGTSAGGEPYRGRGVSH